MAEPLVSIILPVYNGEDRLERSIKSVQSQTYKNWELIIVNDCSKDRSLEISEDFASRDDRIKIINHEINKKLPGALNTGFSQSSGEFLTWTSHDNEFKPLAIETMVAFMQKNPKIGLVYANEEKINDYTDEQQKLIKEGINKIIFGNVIGACFLYRKTVKEVVGEYDETLFLAEDYDYWLRIWREFECQNIDNVLYRYYLSDSSLTSTQRPGVVTATLAVIAKNLLARSSDFKDQEEEFLKRWFKYWYKFSFRKRNYNFRLGGKFLLKLTIKYPIAFLKMILAKA
jgi:glycosyltransferase involved in cell wall biosynthesis